MQKKWPQDGCFYEQVYRSKLSRGLYSLLVATWSLSTCPSMGTPSRAQPLKEVRDKIYPSKAQVCTVWVHGFGKECSFKRSAERGGPLHTPPTPKPKTQNPKPSLPQPTPTEAALVMGGAKVSATLFLNLLGGRRFCAVPWV